MLIAAREAKKTVFLPGGHMTCKKLRIFFTKRIEWKWNGMVWNEVRQDGVGWDGME